MDREDFFRLKKVQGKKKRVQAERDVLDKENQRLQDQADQEEADKAGKAGEEGARALTEKRKKEKEAEEEAEKGKGDLLGGGEAEEDVIF